MENQDKELAGIILKSVVTALTQEEQQRLSCYLQASEANREKYRELTSAANLEQKFTQYQKRNDNRDANYRLLLDRIGTTPTQPVHRLHFLRRWGWAAAAAVLLLAAGTYFMWPRQQPEIQVAGTSGLDIAPGRSGAVLTLADGSQLVLDSLGNGVVANQNGAQVIMNNGQLSYDPSGNTTGQTVYNTMSTPKGRQFNLTLPDGSRVWLNAASSLKYPTAFTGRERLVEVSGEAYFEVARNAAIPFKVNVRGKATVEVLGTHFNINAYTDEEVISTTLLEGSIRTYDNSRNTPVELQPGQQALVRAGQPVTVNNNADIDKVMAWKEGLFNFNDASLQEVMRQLERWYDIEVVYEKGVPDQYFYGKVSKDLPLSGLLKVLEATRVHFRIEEGRKLIVMP